MDASKKQREPVAFNTISGLSVELSNNCVSLAVAANALTQGILKLMAKIKARLSALVKLAARISEMPPAAAAETFAPKVELTRLPPAP